MTPKETGKKEAVRREHPRKGIRAEKTVSTGDAVNYLEEIARCLKKGKLVVTQGDECFVLKTPDTETVTLKIDIKEKKNKGKIEIAISWQQAPEVEAAQDLIVSATEPAPPKSPAGAAAEKAQARPPASGSEKKPA